MNTFWISLVGILNKAFPFLVAFLAYMKGRSSVKEEIAKENLEKELEYAKIDAAKPDTVDDDVERMRTGTF